MKKNNRKIFSEKSNEEVNFRLVGLEKSNEKIYKNVEFEIIDEETNNKSKDKKSNEKVYIDVKDAFGKDNKTHSNITWEKGFSIFNFIITFILEMIFSIIAFTIPILGFVLSIVYFIKDEKLFALIFVILAIAGYITNYNLFLGLINSMF